MPKLPRGRLDGPDGMSSFTAAEVLARAEALEQQIRDPLNTDDPKWLQRWADRLRRLAAKKEKARKHKERH